MDWLELIEVNMQMGCSTSNLHARHLIKTVREQELEIKTKEENLLNLLIDKLESERETYAYSSMSASDGIDIAIDSVKEVFEVLNKK